MKVIKLDHNINLDDLSSSDDDNLLDGNDDDKPLLLHQINKLNGRDRKVSDDYDDDGRSKVHIQNDDTMYEVKIVWNNDVILLIYTKIGIIIDLG